MFNWNPISAAMRRMFAAQPVDTQPVNTQSAGPPRTVVAYLAYQLTEEGQKQARLAGSTGERNRIIAVAVGEHDVDVFRVDEDGYLLAATYTGAMMTNRPIPRSPLLSADIAFDRLPMHGHDLIGWIRTLAAHQNEAHQNDLRARALEELYASSATQGVGVGRVQIDSGPSGGSFRFPVPYVVDQQPQEQTVPIPVTMTRRIRQVIENE